VAQIEHIAESRASFLLFKRPIIRSPSRTVIARGSSLVCTPSFSLGDCVLSESRLQLKFDSRLSSNVELHWSRALREYLFRAPFVGSDASIIYILYLTFPCLSSLLSFYKEMN